MPHTLDAQAGALAAVTAPIADIPAPSAPSPVVDGADGPRLRGSRCRACGERFFPQRQVCFRCAARELEPVALGPSGELYSFATVHVGPAGGVPYTLGYVDLDEGIRVLTRIAPSDQELRPCIPVRLVVAADGSWAFAAAERRGR